MLFSVCNICFALHIGTLSSMCKELTLFVNHAVLCKTWFSWVFHNCLYLIILKDIDKKQYTKQNN